MNRSRSRLWIAWETQRRSIQLSKKLGCRLVIIEREGPLRYPISIYLTLKTFLQESPRVIFVQNPSMILSAIACLYGLLTRIPVVVDRHTTFLLNKEYEPSLRLKIFRLLHRFTVRFATLTLVTNNHLSSIVKGMGGIPFVLPDMLPEFEATERYRLKGRYSILFPCSYSDDEPVREVIDAMRHLEPDDFYLYITGNFRKLEKDTLAAAPKNIVFTGFLDDQEYINMLFSVDAVMALTTADSCMLCGCYEAVAACKPLITSDKDVLKEYFEDAVFTDNSPESISNSIMEIFENLYSYRKRINSLREKLNIKWEAKFINLEKHLETLSSR